VLVSLACTPALTPVLRRLSVFAGVLALAAFQFAAEGLVPLILIAVRRERLSDYGFSLQNIGKSIALGVFLTVIYDLARSFNAGT
jgi:hypothetical protein